MLSSLPSFRLRPLSALAVCLLLSACGGGGSSETASTVLAVVTGSAGASVSASESFPTGLVVASPTELTAGSATAASTTASARARALAAPLGAGVGRAELTDMAARIEAVLAGDTTVSLAGLVSFGNLFQQGGNAGCYGPQMLYANHEDGSGTESGLLPGGDLGRPTPAAASPAWWRSSTNARPA
jgi:hypothetical protein